jgi:hypothetical protein
MSFSSQLFACGLRSIIGEGVLRKTSGIIFPTDARFAATNSMAAAEGIIRCRVQGVQTCTRSCDANLERTRSTAVPQLLYPEATALKCLFSSRKRHLSQPRKGHGNCGTALKKRLPFGRGLVIAEADMMASESKRLNGVDSVLDVRGKILDIGMKKAAFADWELTQQVRERQHVTT